MQHGIYLAVKWSLRGANGLEFFPEGFFDVPCALRLAPATGFCASVPGAVVFSAEGEAGLDCSVLDGPAVFAEPESGCSLLDDPAVSPVDPEAEPGRPDCPVLDGSG